MNEELIHTARELLIAAGLTPEQADRETGFGLRRLANCPPVAPVKVKVAAGALSPAGAVMLARAGLL